MSLTSAAALKRVRDAISADQDPSRGGDLLRLLKPETQSQTSKYAMSAEAYSFLADQESLVALPTRRDLPEGIAIAINGAECDHSMGLFAEINRAWVIVDNILFLWNYDHAGNAYETYRTTNSQLIVSIGLCTPKAGFESLFPNSASKPDYLIAVATPIDVTLLRLDLRNGGGSVLTETNITASTDGVIMRAIKGTSDGRVFMGGEDGSIHEFFYETKRNFMHTIGVKRQCFTLDRSRSSISGALSWLVPPAVQNLYTTIMGPPDPVVHIEVDDGRRLLYSVSQSGVLSLFHVGKPDELNLVSTLNLGRLRDSLGAVSNSMVGVKQVDLEHFKFCSMDVVSSPISPVHLIVTSTNGVRIFFTTFEYVSVAAAAAQSHGRVSGKRLNPISVRGPPKHCNWNDMRRVAASDKSQPLIEAVLGTPTPVIRAFSSGDVTLLAMEDETTSITRVMGLVLDLTSGSPVKWELGLHREQVIPDCFDSVDLGRVCAIQEMRPPSYKIKNHWTGAADRAEDASTLSDLVMQFSPGQRKRYLVLTAAGVRVLERQYPIDALARILERSKDTADKSTVKLFRRFALDESSAMALGLAIQNKFSADSSIFVQTWSQSQLSARASYFFSNLGFSIPASALGAIRDAKEREREFRLPCSKTTFEEERKRITSALALTAAPSAIVALSTKANADVERAVFAGGSSQGQQRDSTNKSLEEAEADVMFSGCFEGLVLLTGRLFRPIWSWTILSKGEFRFNATELDGIRRPLEQLVDFMETHHPFQDAVKKKQKRILKGLAFTPGLVEEIRTGELHSLLRRVVDALNFLAEIQRPDRKFSTHFKWILADSADDQSFAEKMTFEDFITSEAGLRLSRILVRALIDKDESLKRGPFLNKLSQTVGDFFSKTYWSHVGAIDEFALAERSTLNQELRLDHLSRAVKLVDDSFRTLSFSNEASKQEALERLEEAANRCCAIGEHWRAVKLCATLARSATEAARQDVSVVPSGLDYLVKSPVDVFRSRCYVIAGNALDQAERASMESLKRALEVVLRSEDASFQYFLFQHLLAQPEKVRLLLDCPTTSAVESFLKNSTFNTYGGRRHRDVHLVLYARWLASQDKSTTAAKVLRDLASIDDDVDLENNPTVLDRLEYLNDSIVYDESKSASESMRRRLNLVKCTVSLKEALIKAVGERHPVIQELTFRLVKEDRLFTIASEFGAWEECFVIAQHFSKDDQLGEILDNIYGELLGPYLGSWDVPTMLENIRRIAERCGNDPRMLPLDKLVDAMEYTSIKRAQKLGGFKGWSLTWLLDSLVAAKVPYLRLFVAYARFLASFEETGEYPPWALHLILALIEKWHANDPDDLGIYLHRAPDAGVDVGSVLSVLHRAERRFASNKALMDQINELVRKVKLST